MSKTQGHCEFKIFDQLAKVTSVRARARILKQYEKEGLPRTSSERIMESLAMYDEIEKKRRNQFPAYWPMGSKHPIGEGKHSARVVAHNTQDQTITLWYGNDS